MMPRARTALLIAVAAVSTASSAQDTRTAELADANQQLNASYRVLMRELGPREQASLRAAQKAWIVFRDADCAFGFGDRRDCLMQRTDEREKQLRDSVYFNPQGKQIVLPARRE